MDTTRFRPNIQLFKPSKAIAVGQKTLSLTRLFVYTLAALGICLYGTQTDLSVNLLMGSGLFSAGILFWTLTEYLIHRFLFHAWGTAGKKRLLPPLLKSHGRHHLVPEEMATGFLHPVLGLPLMLLIGGGIFLVVKEYVFFFMPGFLFGYIGYMLIHYLIHRVQAPFSWMRPLWKHHFLHHTRFPDKCYGVTTIFWDRLFGTFEDGENI